MYGPPRLRPRRQRGARCKRRHRRDRIQRTSHNHDHKLGRVALVARVNESAFRVTGIFRGPIPGLRPVISLPPMAITSWASNAARICHIEAGKERLHCVRKRKRIRLNDAAVLWWSRPHRIIVHCRWIRGSDPPAAHGVPHETGARTIPALWAASAEVGVTQGPSLPSEGHLPESNTKIGRSKHAANRTFLRAVPTCHDGLEGLKRRFGSTPTRPSGLPKPAKAARGSLREIERPHVLIFHLRV